jgi:hypothetical protein
LIACTIGLCALTGCEDPAPVPKHPTWADVAPILRGQCGGCHGYTAHETGGGFRFDFYDAVPDVCGDAALAMDSNMILAGSPLGANQIAADVVARPGERWPRMPPQPSPALPDNERETLERWAAQAVKGPPPAGDRPPTIAVSQFPAMADQRLEFTAVIDDPDGDSVIGVIEIGEQAFVMNRPGSFAVSFDSSQWNAGSTRVTAVLCDGWSSVKTDLGPIEIRHGSRP